MPEFGFPAQPRYASMSRLIADLRSRSDDTRVEAVTGRFRDVTSVRRGNVDEIMQLEKSIADLNTFAESIALSETRASIMQANLGTAVDIAQNAADTSILVLSNETEIAAEVFSDRARDDLNALVSNFNANFAGRALFAGDDAGTVALADAETIFTTSVAILEAAPTAAAGYADLQNEFFGAGGAFETMFYQGGAGRAPLTEIAEGQRVDYGVKADEDAIRSALFNTIVFAAAYDRSNTIPDDERRALLQHGSDGMRGAITEMIDVRSRLGTAEARIADVKSRNVAAEAAFTLRFNELAGADTFEAALTLTELDTQLQTAYQTTARLSNLSLANYI
ncbi:MAG: flagellin [Pseudomonadota bacterium]